MCVGKLTSRTSLVCAHDGTNLVAALFFVVLLSEKQFVMPFLDLFIIPSIVHHRKRRRS